MTTKGAAANESEREAVLPDMKTPPAAQQRDQSQSRACHRNSTSASAAFSTETRGWCALQPEQWKIYKPPRKTPLVFLPGTWRQPKLTFDNLLNGLGLPHRTD